MGLGHGGAALGQAVEGQTCVNGADGAHRVHVHQLLQLLPVGGGAEHEDFLVYKASLAQCGGVRRLGHGKAADALVPQEPGHVHQTGASRVSGEGGVDGGTARPLPDHGDVLLDCLSLYNQGFHGCAAFPQRYLTYYTP